MSFKLQKFIFTFKTCNMRHRYQYLIFVLLFSGLNQIFAQSSNFNFNTGNTQNWITRGPYNQEGTLLASSFSSINWSDSTNYPNPIGSDTNDLNGSVSFSAYNGTGVVPVNQDPWWIMQIASPDLSTNPDWQVADGYSIKIIENMSIPRQSEIYANLYVKIHDNDLGTDRFFYNDSAQILIRNSWNSYSFDWSAISNFPTSYTLLEVFVNIWGTVSGFYSGGVFLDEVNIIDSIPGQPILLEPKNNATNISINPTLTWQSVEGASYYRLRVFTYSGALIFDDQNIIGTSRQIGPLNYDASYIWFVNARNGIGEGPVSETFTFTTVPNPVLIVDPPNQDVSYQAGDTTFSVTSNLNWSVSDNATWLTISPTSGNNNGTLTATYTENTTTSQRTGTITVTGGGITRTVTVTQVAGSAVITVISPNGNEMYLAGASAFLYWTDNFTDSVRIDLYKAGIFNTNIAPSTESDGTYNWNIPSGLPGGSDYKIKISSVENSNIFDLSDNNFTIRSNISNQGLVAYYPFNGNANDESDNGNDGTVTEAALTTDRFDNENSAYYFDGVNDYIEVNDASTLDFGNGDFTVACWFKTSSEQYLIQKGGTGGESISWALGIEPGQNSDYIFFSGDWINLTPTTKGTHGSTAVTDNSWHFAIGMKSGTQLKVYVDGVLEGTNDLGIQTSADTDYPMEFGTRTDFASYTFFKGIMDDIRIYNRALTETEILKLYHEGGWETNNEISILSPNGGEVWGMGTQQYVKWSSTNIINVMIEFSADNGASWDLVAESVPSTGIYSWRVPLVQTIQGRIKISNVTDDSVFDISDNKFTIESVTSTEIFDPTIPEQYELKQNYPNPFNPSTKISYEIPEAGLVVLKVYDLLGNEIAKLVNENKQTGRYEVEFKAENLASGVYIYRLSVNEFISTKKMILVR